MPTLTGRPSGAGTQSPAADRQRVSRSLHAAYSRERLEEVIRAVAEDALNPSRVDVAPWHDETPFEDQLRDAVREIAHTADGMLTQRLTSLVETAPPRVAGRLASAGSGRLTDAS